MRRKLTKTVVEGLRPSEKPYEVRDTDLKGFLCRVEKSGLRVFYYVYLRPKDAVGAGTRTRHKLGIYPNLSPDGARATAQIVAGDVGRGTDPQAERRAARMRAERAKQATLGAFLRESYEPWALANLKSHAFQLARIRSDFASWLDLPITDIVPFKVEALRHRWRKGGKKPISINRDIQRLQSVVSRALQWKVIDSNPLSGLKPMKVDKTGRSRHLSREEELALRNALSTREDRLRRERTSFNQWLAARDKELLPEHPSELVDYLKPMVLLALNTGLRRGELLGLTWGSVDLTGKWLTIRGCRAKSGNTRHMPLNPEALQVLSCWRERQGCPDPDTLVFSGRGGAPMQRIDTSWRGVLKAAGLRDFRFHDLRHTFASRLVESSVDLYAVQLLLGHADMNMTKRYAHLAPEHLQSAVARLAAA